MFAGLRLDGFIGSDDEQYEIDATDSGEHVANEALVAGDIDEAEAKGVAGRLGQVEVGKADVDGDAAALLFFQAIGVDAGKGFDQRGLTVVDVASCADDDGLHRFQYMRRFVYHRGHKGTQRGLRKNLSAPSTLRSPREQQKLSVEVKEIPFFRHLIERLVIHVGGGRNEGFTTEDTEERGEF